MVAGVAIGARAATGGGSAADGGSEEKKGRRSRRLDGSWRRIDRWRPAAD
jgi:hypothetical protein